MRMESGHNLAAEIELCGKLRDDIGTALKISAEKAAKYGLLL